MTAPTTIVLFTGYYPYDAPKEYPFINPEIKHLCLAFDRVIIVPAILDGVKAEVPSEVIIEESYGRVGKPLSYAFTILGLAFISPLLWKGLFRRPQTLYQPSAAIRLLKTAGKAEHLKKWVMTFIGHNKIDLERTIFYTYWLDAATLGIGLVKRSLYPQIRLISRAHGFDVYETRHHPPFFPCRAESLEKLDRLFLISENGRNHISLRYPWFAKHCEVSRLGVKRSGFVTSASKDGVFRVVSCSYIGDVKRVDLLLRGLIQLALNHPQQRFEWQHIGDGPMRDDIQYVLQQAPPNLKGKLLGQLSNAEVITFYKDNSIDIFVNMSSSEGIPVSVMEAESCGIPVVATSVGGTPEIVTNQSGMLLAADPTADEISKAIWQVVSDPEQAVRKREESFRIWQDQYNADVNFPNFCKRISSLIN